MAATSHQDRLYGPCDPTHRVIVDLSNKSAHVLDADGATVCHVGPGITRSNVAEALAPHGWAPDMSRWRLTSPPDGFWTWAWRIPDAARYHAPMEPVHPCRRIDTRSCPVVYAGPCGDDRPCARLESTDPTPWLHEIRSDH